jgi:hypothetical protein
MMPNQIGWKVIEEQMDAFNNMDQRSSFGCSCAHRRRKSVGKVNRSTHFAASTIQHSISKVIFSGHPFYTRQIGYQMM